MMTMILRASVVPVMKDDFQFFDRFMYNSTYIY